MKDKSYLIIGKNGIRGVRKSKPNLSWDEVAVLVSLDIPDVLFQRPLLEATIIVDKDKLQFQQISPQLVINTKEFIEQQTGAKIDFRILEIKEENGEQK
jgi:hypothetical protein